jgi:hypothetical protein
MASDELHVSLPTNFYRAMNVTIFKCGIENNGDLKHRQTCQYRTSSECSVIAPMFPDPTLLFSGVPPLPNQEIDLTE